MTTKFKRKSEDSTITKKNKNGNQIVPKKLKLSTEKTSEAETENNKEPKDKSNVKTFVKGKHDEKKPEDWNEFKKQKKELRLKRKQSKTLFELITKAKKLGEKLRLKKLPGGQEARESLIKELHSLLSENYIKVVLAHDMARVVQSMLKHANQELRNEIIKEITPATVQMLQSKYGRFCIKASLTYGTASARSAIIRATYGRAVKLSSHAVSASVFEHAYSKYAQPLEKIHLIQEFYGDMYKQSKDDTVKHLRDVYKDSTDMKTAALGAAKANFSRILNKDLLDSGLVQSALSQYLTECSIEDRAELITQLAPHAVVLSNSKDGAKAVMQCFWNGTNKDRKVIMKSIKQNIVELCKHEHGHAAIIAVLDAADDTVLLNKAFITDILCHSLDIANNNWGRRVVLWLVAPGSSTHFHPSFTIELEVGRDKSTCKKSTDVRQKEILDCVTGPLLVNIASEAKSWLANPSIAVVTAAILKTGSGKKLQNAFKHVADVVIDPEWKIKNNDISISGIEDAGFHMVLKNLCKNDKVLLQNNDVTFGEVLINKLNDDVLGSWITLNRGCFLLITLWDNSSSAVQNELKEKLTIHLTLIKEQNLPGSKILLKKIK